ncbi:hypothetical protein M0804_013541 [Polistes exclamans]|nr:hypothetical protein M0804_013541 [Polistes exclamans]
MDKRINLVFYFLYQVIDASGEPKSGFIYGNNYWLGSRSQCEEAGNKNPFQLTEEVLQNNSRFRPIQDEFPPFEVKFFVANFRHNSTLQYHIELLLHEQALIILGMCLPASCSKDQLSILLENVLRKRTLFKGELYSADFTLVECMSWSWYLANDMQYFVIVNLLLFLSSSFDRQWSLGREIYFSSWVRIGPYLVGVIAAYIVLKLNHKLLWKKKTIILFWILVSLCNLIVLIGLYQTRISVLAAAFYVALGRNVWAIGIAWVIIACCTNNGGIVNRILSWKIWIPLIIDASGEPKTGFIYGNNYWLGSRSQCEDAKNRDLLILSEKLLRNNSRFRDTEDEFPPFEVKFFVANFQHNSTLQYHTELLDEDLIILGMCLSAFCSKKQLSILLENVLRKRILFKGKLYKADLTLVEDNSFTHIPINDNRNGLRCPDIPKTIADN